MTVPVNNTPVIQTNSMFHESSEMSTPVKTTRKCRPGYKSRSKILRSANRLQVFIADKIRKENKILRSEILHLQDLTTSFVEHKDVLNIENLKLKRHVESLELQLTILKNKFDDKEEAVNTANTKINSLEENKVIIEDKLNSYRASLRKLIREKDRIEDKGKQK